jgi:hypothetical protein
MVYDTKSQKNSTMSCHYTADKSLKLLVFHIHTFLQIIWIYTRKIHLHTVKRQ